jgi:hypothetical protein
MAYVFLCFAAFAAMMSSLMCRLQLLAVTISGRTFFLGFQARSVACLPVTCRVIRIPARRERFAYPDICLLMHFNYLQDLPKRLILLNGAPGAGKGTSLELVRRFSGIPTAYTMSSVIARHRNSNAASLNATSGLVDDAEVCEALVGALAGAPLGTKDVILDGFPRSRAQVCPSPAFRLIVDVCISHVLFSSFTPELQHLAKSPLSRAPHT